MKFKKFAVAPNWNSMGSHSFFDLKNDYYVNSKSNIDCYPAKDFVENQDVSFFDDENEALDYLDYLNS